MMKKMITSIVLACLLMPSICLGGSLVTAEQLARVVIVTPTISAAVPYSSGDQVGGIIKLPSLIDNGSKMGTLLSIQVVDLDAQNANLQFFFFSQAPSTSAGDNNAFSVPDADMLYAILVQSVTAYGTTAATNSIGSVNGSFSTLISTAKDPTLKATGDIYILVKNNTTTPTYTTTSSLQFRIGVWL